MELANAINKTKNKTARMTLVFKESLEYIILL